NLSDPCAKRQYRRALMAGDTPGELYRAPIVDHNARPGTILRLIVFVIVLTGAAVAFSIFEDRLGDPVLLGMLGVLAMIGVGYLFATAIGFVRIAPRSSSELARHFVDTMPAGLVITDARGRIIYAN